MLTELESHISLELTPLIQNDETHIKYASSQRIKTITLLALAILSSWGAVAGSLTMAIFGHSSISIFGSFLTAVCIPVAGYLSWSLTSLGRDLRNYSPIPYDLDNPNRVTDLFSKLCIDHIDLAIDTFDENISHLVNAKLISKEDAKEISQVFEKYSSLNEDSSKVATEWSELQTLLKIKYGASHECLPT